MCRRSHTARFFALRGGQRMEQTRPLVPNDWLLRVERRRSRGRNMTASDPPNSAAEQKRAERLDVARTVYHALTAQDADRVITLCDIRGRLIARHDLRPEEGTQQSAS